MVILPLFAKIFYLILPSTFAFSQDRWLKFYSHFVYGNNFKFSHDPMHSSVYILLHQSVLNQFNTPCSVWPPQSRAFSCKVTRNTEHIKVKVLWKHCKVIHNQMPINMIKATNLGPNGYQNVQTREVFPEKRSYDQIYSMGFTEKSVESICVGVKGVLCSTQRSENRFAQPGHRSPLTIHEDCKIMEAWVLRDENKARTKIWSPSSTW